MEKQTLKQRITSHILGLAGILTFLPLGGLGWAFSSCSDLMDTDSELVENLEDNRLQEPTDSVYSVMGIIYKLQAIADRTVLLGELRSDLTTTTASASKDLKAITNFTVDTENAYNRISDYYAVINNCNYYLKNVNKDLVKNDRKVFEAEYAVVKAFRAWTYLQVAQVYGNVPLVTEPLLTEGDAQNAMNQGFVGINEICNYFIDDIKPYVDTKLPVYGQINEQNSQKFFIPVRALLGDLCLWAGRYTEAAQYYHDYLSLRTAPLPTGRSSATWADINTKEFRSTRSSLSYGSQSSECLCYIPMESNGFYGIKSELTNIFNSTSINQQFAQATPTKRMRELSAASDYCGTYTKADGSQDTIYAPKENLDNSEYAGDLRFGTSFSNRVSNKERYARTSNEIQSIDKLNRNGVTLYRINMVYLRYAEALNRAGFPQAAFAILKYGLYADIISKQIDDYERATGGGMISFDGDNFTVENTQGIHSRGSGRAECDTLYQIPMPATQLASRADTVAYQIPLVEDMIVNEMALEGAFEGYRFYDLMRVALRRNDASYLADPVSRRNGTVDDALRSRLLEPKNWYLPLQ
ncbi:MAG: RagB/SusD family nutrient uptake outer membrane protein [Prevotella sp.]|nr:RagB/SusD family nutrient uptake outer membrane protein [Prevotella sp.]